MSDVGITEEEAQAAAEMALGQQYSLSPEGKPKTDKDFLADANKRLKKNYKTVDDYLTNNGKFKKDSPRYKNRLAKIENFRGQAQRETIVLSGNLLEEARKLYGSTADLYNIPELKPLFEQAFINQWEPAELLRAIDNTDWAKSRTAAQEKFDVQKVTNPVELDNSISQGVTIVRRVLTDKGISIPEDQIKTIAEKGVRGGWTSNQWDEFSASEAVAFINAGQAQAPTGGVPGAAPTTAQPVSPVTATDLRKIAKQFGVPVAEATLNQWVADIVTNKKTQDQFTEYSRASAQTLYPSITDRLKTNTFDEIVSPYKRLYSDVLETPEDNIDLTDPKFSNLFASGDSAKPRMMTSTEWVGFLRKRPEWQNTQNAYREYAQAADTLNKIFGGTR